MDESGQVPDTRNRLIPLTLFGILIAATLYLLYGPDAGPELAGIAAFLAIPGALGGLIAQAADPEGNQSPMGCFGWPTIGLLAMTGIAMLFFGEGAVCVAMILPLWLPAAIAGALVNRLSARRRKRIKASQSQVNSAGWLLLPLAVVIADTRYPAPWVDVSVERQLVIAAPVERVWPILFNISNIDSAEGKANFTHDFLQIPRPTNAVVVNRQSRFIRKATWGNDAKFDEVIDTVVPYRLLSWRFAFPDSSIQRHTDRHISPDGPTLKIVSGRYEIAPAYPNSTRLKLITTYKMRGRLTTYLQWWGDVLLGDIQHNVLTIIQDRAE
jgi:uncharacterized protein YndB with AHSA1/START domain